MSDARAVRLLKRELREIFKATGSRTVFLELYAGHGGLSKHLREEPPSWSSSLTMALNTISLGKVCGACCSAGCAQAWCAAPGWDLFARVGVERGADRPGHLGARSILPSTSTGSPTYLLRTVAKSLLVMLPCVSPPSSYTLASTHTFQ